MSVISEGLSTPFQRLLVKADFKQRLRSTIRFGYFFYGFRPCFLKGSPGKLEMAKEMPGALINYN